MSEIFYIGLTMGTIGGFIIGVLLMTYAFIQKIKKMTGAGSMANVQGMLKEFGMDSNSDQVKNAVEIFGNVDKKDDKK